MDRIEMFLLLFMIIGSTEGVFDNNHIGCFINNLQRNKGVNLEYYKLNDCIDRCKSNFYRYAAIRNESACFCMNFLGSEYSVKPCEQSCNSCPEKNNITDVYTTGSTIPGPPRELKIYNVTDTTAIISWSEPLSFVNISEYELKVNILHTFSTLNTMNLTLKSSNNTFVTELTLQPATKYNITLTALSRDGNSIPAFKIIETLIGVPDNVPSIPTILKHEGKEMLVRLNPVINNYGPISAYQVIVINEDMNQPVQFDNLKSHKEAKREDIGYYISAEIQPQDVFNNFTIGDGRLYGGFYNAPLESDSVYQVLQGVVSRYNGVTKFVYSNLTQQQHNLVSVDISPVQPDDETPGIIIGLSIAIGLLSCLLVAGIIGFFVLTRRLSQRRRRLTDNQELTLQGPIIEVENSGYIPEDEIIPTNHYDNLKQQLWNIPQTFIKIEPTNSLGIGKFGRVNSGTVRKDNSFVPVAVYTIPDRKLGRDNKRAMLKDLDFLIRSGKHDNILSLVGTCESPDTLFVVLEYASMNLKDLLLGSRDSLPGRFSNMQESQALDISIGVANGMQHLESLKIVHKQLCARNILITNGFIPKVSGYGLAQYCNPNMVPDYTRWTAAEVFKSTHYVTKCDIWSYACLLWEICVLGGTPYSSVPNNEIPEKISHGLRLMQLRYISDELYQLMLNCWQLDLDERPTFADLKDELVHIKGDPMQIHLNFNLYPEFQYEQFYPNMELAARTVFQ